MATISTVMAETPIRMSVSGPEQIDENVGRNYKHIELFSELCACMLDYQEMREKIFKIGEGIFHLFTNHDLDWTELQSKYVSLFTCIKCIVEQSNIFINCLLSTKC